MRAGTYLSIEPTTAIHVAFYPKWAFIGCIWITGSRCDAMSIDIITSKKRALHENVRKFSILKGKNMGFFLHLKVVYG